MVVFSSTIYLIVLVTILLPPLNPVFFIMGDEGLLPAVDFFTTVLAALLVLFLHLHMIDQFSYKYF